MVEKIDEDTRQALLKGDAWYERHRDFVHRNRISEREIWLDMIGEKVKGDCVKPSGSDLHRPDLWLDFHWRWFFKEKAKWLP